jgi:hypothetical protein
VLTACTGLVYAKGARQDAKAIEVLKQMSVYTASLDRVAIKGTAFSDARLGAGLMVSNSDEVQVSISRPGSMRINSSDGVTNKGLYFDDGLLTVFNSENKLYAQATVPKEIDAAMSFALEEFGIEPPLMDLIYKDAFTQLVTSEEEVLYLTNKSLIGGKNCHHIAIRGPEIDVQLWVEEGDQPLPRKIMITSKWESGSPRFVANLSWESDPKFKPGLFEFKAPEGAMKIEFAREASE